MQNLKVQLIIEGDSDEAVVALRRVKAELDGTGKIAERTGTKISRIGSLIKGAFAGAGIAALTRKITGASEAYASLDARLKILNRTEQERAQITERLKNLATETGSQVESAATLYIRMDRALRGVVDDSQTLLDATEAVTKALAVNNLTGAESAAVLTQLSQAFQKGTLNGDEFRTIAESAPAVLDAMQEALGVTRDKIFDMAAAGEISGKLLAESLARYKNTISAQFEQLPDTASSAFDKFSENLKIAFAEFDKNANLSKTLESGLDELGDAAKWAAENSELVTESLTVLAGGAVVNKLITSLGSLKLAFDAAAVSALAFQAASGLIIAGAAIELIKRYREEVRATAEELRSIRDAAMSADEALISAFKAGQGGDFAGASGIVENAIESQKKKLDELKSKLRETEAVIEQYNAAIQESGAWWLENSAELEKSRERHDLIQQSIAQVESRLGSLQYAQEAASTGTLTLANQYEKLQTALEKIGIELPNLAALQKTATNDTLASTIEIENWTKAAEKQVSELQQQALEYQYTKQQLIEMQAARLLEKASTDEQRQSIIAARDAMLDALNALDAAKKKQAAAAKAAKQHNAALESQADIAGTLSEAWQMVASDVELLEARYQSIIEKLEQVAQSENATTEQKQKAIELTEKLRAQLDKEKAAIEKTNTARDDLLEQMKLEESLVGKTRYERELAIRMYDLERLGISANADELRRLAEEMLRIEGINRGFSGGDTFSGLVAQGKTLGDILKQAAEGFSDGLSGSIKSMGVLAEGAQMIADMWAQTAGLDGDGRVLSTLNSIASTGMLGPQAQAISQIATFINRITGGKLFGTSYETEASGFSAGINQSGAFGEQWTREVRQRSLFRGRQWRTTTEALADDVARALDEMFNAIQHVAEQASRDFGITVSNIVDGLYIEERDAEGNITRQGSSVGGRFYSEDFAAYQQRLIAENMIAAIAQTTGTVMAEVTTTWTEAIGDFGRGVITMTQTTLQEMNEAHAIAERWRDNAELFLDGANLLYQAQKDILAGNGLLDSLTDTVDLVEQLQHAGEGLLDAYNRIFAANELFTDALAIMGVSIDGTAQEIITLSAEIADAAGGLERAQNLWNSYFEAFYTAGERAQAQLDMLNAKLVEQAAGIGVNPEIGMDAFRAMFEQTLPTLSAESIAQWLEFADTLARVNQIEQERNQALLDYEQASSELAADAGVISDFAQRIAEIAQSEQDRIDTLNALAEAAGLAGASETDLANAHRIASNEAAAAIASLYESTQSLIEQLYGEQATQSYQRNVSRVSSSVSSMFSQWESAIDRIHGFTRSLLQDSRLSPLEGIDRLNAAQSAFNDAIAAANAGDANAAASIPQLLQEYLTAARDVYASGSDYNTIFEQATAAANAIQPPPVSVVPSDQWQNFESGLLQQSAEISDAQRLQLAQQLAQQLQELAAALGRPILEMADELGLSIAELAQDLGLNLSNLTNDTAGEMAQIAAAIGIEMSELADTLGVTLGQLNDTQSLINDAFEQKLQQLPPEFRENLEPLFRDLENASSPDEVAAALEALEAATDQLPLQYRNMLAPFFDNIDPTDYLAEQLSELTSQSGLLERIADNAAALNESQGIPAYQQGTPFVPSDQLAFLHKGEMVIPAPVANQVRSGTGTNRELEAIRREIALSRFEQAQHLIKIADNTEPRPEPYVARRTARTCND